MNGSTLAAVSVAADVLTKGLRLARESRRAICADCRGKGFDLTREPGKRSSRRCMRCRGKGATSVGSTKR